MRSFCLSFLLFPCLRVFGVSLCLSVCLSFGLSFFLALCLSVLLSLFWSFCPCSSRYFDLTAFCSSRLRTPLFPFCISFILSLTPSTPLSIYRSSCLYAFLVLCSLPLSFCPSFCLYLFLSLVLPVVLWFLFSVLS